MEKVNNGIIDEKRIQEMAYYFVDENISYKKFKAKDDNELRVFLKYYKEALTNKNMTLEEEDPEVKLAA